MSGRSCSSPMTLRGPRGPARRPHVLSFGVSPSRTRVSCFSPRLASKPCGSTSHAQLTQRHVRPTLHFGQDHGVLRRELQCLLLALRAGVALPGVSRSFQSLANERKTHTDPLGDSRRRQAAIHRRQKTFPQVPRATLPRSPHHHPSPSQYDREA
jgi:hypothetical protein